jgi:hypothetical protein
VGCGKSVGVMVQLPGFWGSVHYDNAVREGYVLILVDGEVQGLGFGIEDVLTQWVGGK